MGVAGAVGMGLGEGERSSIGQGVEGAGSGRGEEEWGQGNELRKSGVRGEVAPCAAPRAPPKKKGKYGGLECVVSVLVFRKSFSSWISVRIISSKTSWTRSARSTWGWGDRSA